MEEIKKKQEEKEATIVEVPTQHTLMIELADGTVVSDLQLLVKTYNLVEKIYKAVV